MGAMDERTGIDAEAVQGRASVEHYRPPIHDLDEPLWVAEDPETDCRGLGRVQAEAIGNLVAVVDEYGHDPTPYVKLPGDTVERFDARVGNHDSLLSGLRDLF